jgi:signal transduction histidine kinase
MAQKRYSEAEAEALKIWVADSTNVDESRAVVENIALANIYMHNTEKAAYYLKKFSELNRLFSEKSFQTIVSDLSIKYETEKKEMRISSLEQQRTLYIFIGIAGLLLAALISLFSWQKIRREKLKRQLVATNAIVEWEEKEKKRFANELHDGINSMLSAIRTEFATAECRIQDVGVKLDECIETIRRMAHGMMPTSLERLGMRAALEDHCRLFPNVIFHFFGEDRRVEKKIELVVFYCAYELINNSAKHSGAKNINVQLMQREKNISLTVQDDGCGFIKEETSHGSGLKSITDRVTSCNGKLFIISSPGKGTETIIEIIMKQRSTESIRNYVIGG